MKKLFTLAATLLIAVVCMGQTPVITFEKTTHDFGKINEADGRVTTVFVFKNEGMSPLVLSNVRASCGCTTPKWTREPIEPGQSGEITVTYNPNGRPGRFQKTVTVTSNASEPTIKLYIKGEVIPKAAKPVDQYPVKMGDLSLKSKAFNFGSITKGSNKMVKIEYANQTDHPITVDLLLRENDAHFKPHVTLPNVEPGQSGEFQISLQSDECPLYGPINTKAYVMVNGKREMSDNYQVSLNANIKEDFSHLTVEQLQQAPIVETSRDINLGTLVKGKKTTAKITITNVGINPLYIRRIISNDPKIKVITPKAPIKGGRKIDLKVELDNTNVQPAQYARSITLITNDPKKPVINIQLKWVVE